MKQTLLYTVPATLLMLTGCVSVSGTNVQGLVSTPAAFEHASSVVTQSRAQDKNWVAAFGVPELETLIEEAQTHNLSLEAGLANLRAAEASLNSTRSSRYPNVSGSLSSSTSTESDLSDFSTSGRLAASYSLDLFNQNGFSILAAEESLISQKLSQRALELTVSADTASAYLSWVSLQDQFETAENNLKISERIYELVDARYSAGAVSGFDLQSQRASLASARARIPQLEQQIESAETSLALLLGRMPQGFELEAGQLDDWSIPEVEAGLPSELLSQRPDLLAAEADLRSAEANIAAAKAAYFPSIELSAGVSTVLEASLDPVGTLSSTLSVPIFSGGRLDAQTAIAEAQRDALIANYRQSVYAAFGEVDTALSVMNASRLQEDQLAIAEDAAAQALELAETRYTSGADDLNSLLSAQSSYFSARDSRMQARANRLQAVIDLYAALGGNWQT